MKCKLNCQTQLQLIIIIIIVITQNMSVTQNGTRISASGAFFTHTDALEFY